VLIDDALFTSEYIRDQVIPLISNPKKLNLMKLAAKESSIADGTDRLYQLVRSVLPSKEASAK
jgi:UDP-N-acetylglucosamine:LPS N-acetylglucosamine transferase